MCFSHARALEDHICQINIHQTDLILLDFSKAFDKVNHAKLLWKLHRYGIRGNALAWISAFLGNLSQMVVLDGEESGLVPVTSGVPQGSVLGPILFLIYSNDLPDELSSHVRLFADDTAVYLIGEFNIQAPKACLQLKSKTTQSCFNIGLQRVCNPFVVKNELG